MPEQHIISDQRMLQLIDLLKQRQVIRFRQDFCDTIELAKQNFRNIKMGTQHFTIAHITKACEAYNVDANWVLGLQDNVFRKKQRLTIASTKSTVLEQKKKTTDIKRAKN